MAAMVERELTPGRAKEPAHELPAEFGMALPLLSIQIGPSPVAEVVEEKGRPESEIAGWAIELPPAPGDKPGVDQRAMDPPAAPCGCRWPAPSGQRAVPGGGGGTGGPGGRAGSLVASGRWSGGSERRHERV